MYKNGIEILKNKENIYNWFFLRVMIKVFVNYTFIIQFKKKLFD